MTHTSRPSPIFTLAKARDLLPEVKHVTADAVRRAESLAGQLQGLPDEDPERLALAEALRDVASAWAEQVRALGAEAKGLWLVDFDNGEGYYCWSYPEATIAHFHGYGDGFAGRVKIV